MHSTPVQQQARVIPDTPCPSAHAPIFLTSSWSWKVERKSATYRASPRCMLAVPPSHLAFDSGSRSGLGGAVPSSAALARSSSASSAHRVGVQMEEQAWAGAVQATPCCLSMRVTGCCRAWPEPAASIITCIINGVPLGCKRLLAPPLAILTLSLHSRDKHKSQPDLDIARMHACDATWRAVRLRRVHSLCAAPKARSRPCRQGPHLLGRLPRHALALLDLTHSDALLLTLQGALSVCHRLARLVHLGGGAVARGCRTFHGPATNGAHTRT